MPYCLPIVTVTNDFCLAFWNFFPIYVNLCHTYKYLGVIHTVFFLLCLFFWQYPWWKWQTFLFPLLLLKWWRSSFFLTCWLRPKPSGLLPVISNTGTAGKWGVLQQLLPWCTFPSYCTSYIFPLNARWLTDLLQLFFFFNLVGSQSALSCTAFYSFAFLS